MRFVATHFCCSHIYIYCIYIYIFEQAIYIYTYPPKHVYSNVIYITCWGGIYHRPRCIWRASTGTVIAMPQCHQQQATTNNSEKSNDNTSNNKMIKNMINKNNRILMWYLCICSSSMFVFVLLFVLCSVACCQWLNNWILQNVHFTPPPGVTRYFIVTGFRLQGFYSFPVA